MDTYTSLGLYVTLRFVADDLTGLRSHTSFIFITVFQKYLDFISVQNKHFIITPFTSTAHISRRLICGSEEGFKELCATDGVVNRCNAH
jgi:hypothetical protein